MHRIFTERLAVYQTAWIGFVGWVLLNNLAVGDREIDFVKRELIRLSFFISMIADPNSLGLYSINDVVDIHTGSTRTVRRRFRTKRILTVG
jgi:hypothetical protein